MSAYKFTPRAVASPNATQKPLVHKRAQEILPICNNHHWPFIKQHSTFTKNAAPPPPPVEIHKKSTLHEKSLMTKNIVSTLKCHVTSIGDESDVSLGQDVVASSSAAAFA